MHHVRTLIADRRAGMRFALRAAFAAGLAALVCGCKTDQQITGAPTEPYDFRLRHPISITEKDHTLQLFIGANRGTLTPVQRAQVLAFGQTWQGHATGGVIVDLPVGSSNEQSSAETLREIQSILAASGVPARSIAVRNYRVSSRVLATVRISYPRIAAQAGPCGVWPKDIGPSFNRDYFENQPNWNFGCATQRNLAAEVAQPSDLVQPRAETPPYAARRANVMKNYETGTPTASTVKNATPPVGAITDLGK